MLKAAATRLILTINRLSCPKSLPAKQFKQKDTTLGKVKQHVHSKARALRMRFCEEWIPNLGYFGLIASKVINTKSENMADFIIFTGKPLASGAQIYARIMIKK